MTSSEGCAQNPAAQGIF